jgi:hypothetical protein
MVTSYNIQGNRLNVAATGGRSGRSSIGNSSGGYKKKAIDMLKKVIKKYGNVKEKDESQFVKSYSSIVGCYHCLLSIYGDKDLRWVLDSLMTPNRANRAEELKSSEFPENHFARISMIWLLKDLVKKLKSEDVRLAEPIAKLLERAIGVDSTARDTILRFSTVHVKFLKDSGVTCLDTMEGLNGILRETDTTETEHRELFNRRLGLSLEYEMEHPRISGQRFLNLPKGHPLHIDEEFDKSNSIDKGLVWLRTVLLGENANKNFDGSNQYMTKVTTDLEVISEYPDSWDKKSRGRLLILFHVDRWKMTNGTYGN